MYNIAMPVMVSSKTFNRESIINDLKKVGAKRVFLAIPSISYDREKQKDIYDKLAVEVKAFKESGIETGVWFWAFSMRGESPFTHIKGLGGKESSHEMCPADPGFLDFMSEQLRTVAAMNPDLIMFDDDLRFGFLDSGYGCVCKHHMAKISEILGETVTDEGFFEKAFTGKKNKYRSAYLKAAGDSIKNFCARARQAVDSVNSSIRLGACSCMSVWDADGVDSFTLAKILAGNTKPFVRLIGAPYWGSRECWGNRIENVVEIERMERSWYDGDDIEIFAEGDPYPRPRFKVPAALVEIFDSALRASGGFSGILKYMLDYTSSGNYERGYIEKHLDHEDMYEKIESLFVPKKAEGIRVYQALNKIEDADFSYVDTDPDYIQNMFFPLETTLLAWNSFPTTYAGTGCAGIAFGENARQLPKEAFEKPLILDMYAARALTDMGIDVGVKDFGEKCAFTLEYFPEMNEYARVFSFEPKHKNFAYHITLDDKAKVKSEYFSEDGNVPSVYTYENANGMKFVVYNVVIDDTYGSGKPGDSYLRCYCRAPQLISALEEFGVKLPVKCVGNPNMYIMSKAADNGEKAVGFWNCFADYCSNVKVTLDKEYKEAEFIGCEGKLSGNELVINRINAFEFCFVSLK